MKPIRLSGHASEQLAFRVASAGEVIDAIQTARWQQAELGRLECRKDYPYDAIWNKNHYQTKQVRPIFVEEEDEIVVVTVYTYFC